MVPGPSAGGPGVPAVGPGVVPGGVSGPGWCIGALGGPRIPGAFFPSFLPAFLLWSCSCGRVGSLDFLRYKAIKKGRPYWLPFLGFGVLWRRLNVVF